MFQKSKCVVLAGVLLGIATAPLNAAEREDVRKVINLVTSVKMPYPENLEAEPRQDRGGMARAPWFDHRLHQAERPTLVL